MSGRAENNPRWDDRLPITSELLKVWSEEQKKKTESRKTRGGALCMDGWTDPHASQHKPRRSRRPQTCSTFCSFISHVA
jgi:hypothetical protein